MSLENLAGMFSQRSGLQQSITSTIMSVLMSYMMQHFMQKGLSSFLGSGGNDQSSMSSALSQLQNEIRGNPNHPLVQQIQNNAGFQNNNQAAQYIQQAVDMMQEHTNNNPQNMHSLLGNFAQSNGFDLGSLLGGAAGNQQQQPQQKQQQGKGIKDLLGI